MLLNIALCLAAPLAASPSKTIAQENIDEQPTGDTFLEAENALLPDLCAQASSMGFCFAFCNCISPPIPAATLTALIPSVTPTIQARSLFLEAVKAGIIPGMVGDGSDADFVDTAKTTFSAWTSDGVYLTGFGLLCLTVKYTNG
ncbi:hypothetical protein HETIRDRAFT_108527 [Heterobasidion irregulare TC 32-1]|uniref:Uncharacterized protein n=1 Tax=Heterobasidion irregulare (strain TC 32-1) TaxID=747525 RepID=W4JNV9_HETIT|nr:uncharacterized protein HETIRDRAFT_108527 [Heterobasidion irregulare TC 32-1]ETW74750.1 hypothetical protein HETIRDRAFT_108527 [Heterobasidion irregulare TC 32-1]